MNQVPQQAINIAIADDHSIIRKGITEVLRPCGIEVQIEACNGAELISEFKSCKLPPPICVLDISMPELNGYQALRQIKARWRQTKVLMFSMFDKDFSLIELLNSGADGYLCKNCDITELSKAVLTMAEQGKYYSDHEVKMTFAKSYNDLKKFFLNEREIEFMKFCCSDLTYKEIADKMNLSPRTIDDYRNGLFVKFNLKSRVGIALLAINAGIVCF